MSIHAVPFKITPFVWFLTSGSDIAVPGSNSGYEEHLARELRRLGYKGGTVNLTKADLLDLAEFLDTHEIGERESGNTAGSRACSLWASRARDLAATLNDNDKES